MKIFTNKNLIQKIIIALVLVMSLNFCFAPSVHATFGGKLMGYVRDFATALADVAISVVQLGLTGQWTYAVDEKDTAVTDDSVEYWIKDNKFRYPIIQISPELIFAGEIEILDIDFIGNQQEKEYALSTDGSAISELRTIIASWYVTLRTIAVVGLLSVLIYIGIKIIISSTSQDRAKYKQRLVDWIVAFCLLFFMHYIMAVAVNVIEKVNDMLDGTSNIQSGIPIPDEYGKVQYNPTTVIDSSTGESMDESQAGTELREFQSDLVQQIIEGRGKVNYLGSTIDLKTAVDNGYMIYPQVTSAGDSYTYKYEPNADMVASGAMASGGIEVTFETITLNGTVYMIGGSATSSDSANYDVSGINEYLDTIPPYVSEDIGIDIERPDVGTSESGSLEGASIVTSASGNRVAVSSSAITDGSEILYYINYVRLFLNVVDKDEYIPMSVGYLLIYIVLVVITIMFAVRYMKRVIYVAFLTLMAPLVVLTYPIDKIKDRKSTSIQYVV